MFFFIFQQTKNLNSVSQLIKKLNVKNTYKLFNDYTIYMDNITAVNNKTHQNATKSNMTLKQKQHVV